MSLGRQKPSEYFLGAILRGYDKEKATGSEVTCSAIWNHVCRECIQRPGAFLTMFEWDTRKGKQNRISTIADCIRAGLVPGLKLEVNEKGYERVVE